MPVEEILEAHSLHRDALASRIQAILEGQWSSVINWDATGVTEFSEQTAIIVEGAQSVAVSQAETYVSQVLADLAGKFIPVQGIKYPGNLRGVPTKEVYARPFVDVWMALKDGELFEDATNKGLTRLREIADDDMSLAYRWGTQKAMQANKIDKYRRVVRPELSRGGTCPLCHLASGNTYKTTNLLPIHTHCRCAVMPILGSFDPGARLNAEDLGSLEAPKEIPVVRNHGELGPLLQVAGQHFTSEAQVA